MVLVSHKYKFIYLKNVKVGGTSCQVVFSKYCHNKDIQKNIEARHKINGHTPIYKEVNTKDGFISLDWKYRSFLDSKEIENYDKMLILPGCLAEHSRSILIKYKFLEYFNNYFKFCIVRNPYDRIVSRYNWDKKEDLINLSFKEYLEFEECNGLVNKINDDWYDRCTLYGKPCCDYYIKFDNILEGINNIFKILNINDNFELPHVKVNEKKNNINYREYYDSYTRKIVERNCAEEINYFNWEF